MVRIGQYRRRAHWRKSPPHTIMLPSRGLSRTNTASALRYSFKPVRTPSTRQFSQAQSQTRSLLPQTSIRRSAQLRNGVIIPVGSLGLASSVFAQRSGAARNLSFWGYGSQPAAPKPSETSAVASSQPPVEPAQAQAPIPEPSSAVTPTESAAAATPSPPVDSPEWSLDNINLQTVFTDIPERIGFLKDYGLDYGWGPTSSIQWALEHIHVYTGMPWWGSIATLAVLFRIAAFYPTLSGTKHAARLQKVQQDPKFLAKKAEMEQARAMGNVQSMMVAQSHMRAAMKESGAKLYMSILGPMLTVPFSFGAFRLLRAMANLPVPSWEAGGFWWVQDLTFYDPYYILPTVSGILTYYMFKTTQAATGNQTETQKNMISVMMYVLPPVTFVFTAWMPAAVQWFLLVFSSATIVQSRLLLNPSVRAWANVPALPTKPSSSTLVPMYQTPNSKAARTAPSESVQDRISKGMKSATSKLGEMTGNTDERLRWKKAHDYEEKRAAEERQKRLRRMEDMRRGKEERNRY
ncbi:hypothetical protein F5Y18DRAFT_393835 [Xylariaceae sp. FL1019]|nr:hypothetical protein F5Y18DRAFT_393835 [Xylariaceae sp. FL1019]